MVFSLQSTTSLFRSFETFDIIRTTIVNDLARHVILHYHTGIPSRNLHPVYFYRSTSRVSTYPLTPALSITSDGNVNFAAKIMCAS